MVGSQPARSPGGTRVLVPLDGSALAEQAVPYARALAGPDGEVLFLQVVPDPEPVHGLLGNVIATVDEVLAMYQESARKDLESAAARWRAIVPNAATEVAVGDPAEEILRAVGERECAAVVIASHGRGALGRWTFGSVADRLARSATVPVMIVRPRDAVPEVAPAAVRRLVVPLDGSELAAEALPVAADLASRLGASVLLVRAINPGGELTPYPSLEATYPAELYEELTTELEAEARRNLASATETLAAMGIEASTTIEVGLPVACIEEVVEPGDVIVMTSHGRGGVRRWLLGSVAEKLIREGPAPVVLVPSSARAAAPAG